MDIAATKKWLKTALIAAVGGGLTSTLAAAFDPQRFNIAHDLGSGKLWDFFLEGSGITFAALLIKSPLGQQFITAYKDSQAQLAKGRADLDATAAELKKPPSIEK